MKKNIIKTLFNTFQDLHIVVIGDLMLDSYLYGTVARISPEAPVPVLEYNRKESKLGGSANVSLNLSALGINTTCIGLIGQDDVGSTFKNKMRKGKLSTRGIIVDKKLTTTEKTRVVANHQQLLRIDQEKIQNINATNCKYIIQKLKNLKNINGIILSDYAKGVLTSESFEKIISFAKKKSIFISLDPKPVNFSFYNDVDILTPNHHEASQASKMPCNTERELKKVGEFLFKNYRFKKLMITRGEKGMAVFDDSNKVHFIPTFSQSVFDVSGAGDTVIATFTASYLAGKSLVEAAMIANLAASVVISKFGTESITKEELYQAFESGISITSFSKN